MFHIPKLHILRTGFSLDVSSVDFPARGFFLFFGENGSGKSTLLSCLAGISPAYEGEIFFEGRPMKQLERRECASRISYLPQSMEPLPPLPAEDYLAQGLYAGGESRIPELLSYFQIRYNPKKSCRQFSGGETQIMRLVRACAAPRPVILLDEPESFLSHSRKTRLNSLLEDFSEQALVIIAAHDERLFPRAAPVRFQEKGEGEYFLSGS